MRRHRSSQAYEAAPYPEVHARAGRQHAHPQTAVLSADPALLPATGLQVAIPAARLILKAAGVDKGSGEPHKTKVATISQAKVREIAETKMADLNANDIDAAVKIIEGTARSMGITVG